VVIHSVGIIKSSIFEVKKDMGGVFDSLDYALIVRDGRVSDVCPAPVEIPEDKLAEVADAAMRLNQVMRCGLFRVDFDNGKLWCQYSVPVSALTENRIQLPVEYCPVFRTVINDCSPHNL
jgi:hypothetical protein